MQKERLNVYLNPALSATIREMAGNEEQKISRLAEELLELGLSLKKGETIEQQSLPVIRNIVETELRKQFAQQRIDLRNDLARGLLPEIKSMILASTNRLAALLVRAVRDGIIIRRLVYALTSRSLGGDFAAAAYENAKENAGKELAKRDEE